MPKIHFDIEVVNCCSGELYGPWASRFLKIMSLLTSIYFSIYLIYSFRTFDRSSVLVKDNG